MTDKKGIQRSGFGRLSTLVAAGVVVLSFMVLWGYRWFYPSHIGPEQPIPFSHRVHNHVKKISCLVCHDQAMRSAVAGIPPVETCMLCHSRVIVTHPQIRKVRQHYFDKVPIPWERVYRLPDFVYFNHSVHLMRSIDCSRCHGDVSQMDRIEIAQPITMGFCISCHKENKATHDCFTCHR